MQHRFEPDEDEESSQSRGTLAAHSHSGQLASIGAVFGLRHDGVMIVESLIPGGAAAQSGTVEIGFIAIPSIFSYHQIKIF
jgi:hypothetical protein